MKKTVLYCLLFFFATSTFGQWINNPAINNEVAASTFEEIDPISVSDGAGGSIVIFMKQSTSHLDYDLFAQKITATGVIAWGSIVNPIVICNDTTSNAFEYKAIPDDSGGAYITWVDARNATISKVYIQHINAAGSVLWLANGIKVADISARYDYSPNLCNDGNGGVIIGWTGDDRVSNSQQYAQRYNSSGIPQWTVNGVQVCTAPGFRGGAKLLADNSNGAMFFFTDSRNDPHGLNYDSLVANYLTNADIYGQRLSSTGTLLWTSNGVAIVAASGNQDAFENSQVITDGSGGAIVAFVDGRNDLMNNYDNLDLFAQRVNSSGVVQWTANGVAVSTAPGNQFGLNNFIVPDGSGGLVGTWEDIDSARVFVQRINGSGTPMWATNGIAISPAGFGNWASVPVLVNDSLGNYVVIFRMSYASFNAAILAQKLNGSGVSQWATGGVQIADIAEGRSFSTLEPQPVPGNNGSVIVSWSAKGAGGAGVLGTQNIYASKLLTTGVLDGINAGYVTVADGNWNNSATWMGGQVPSPGISATVRHNVTVTTNALCWSLKVEQPNGRVTVKAGVTLRVEH
jgi:hypothetical protein